MSNHPRNATGNQSSTYYVGSLPGINFPLPNSWAGQIRIPGTENDELFFWLFGAEDSQYDDNLISMDSHVPPIWLNGGPGCSSLDGLAKENGPFVFPGNDSNPQPNANSWTKLGNVLYIDQPVGAGYSGGSVEANTNSQVVQSFIPYFTQAIKSSNLDINIQAIAIGNGIFGNYAASTDVVTTSFLEEHNDYLQIPDELMSIFVDADKTCGFSDVLAQATYPPKGLISIPGNPEGENYGLKKRQDVQGSSDTSQDVQVGSGTSQDAQASSGTSIDAQPSSATTNGSPPICTEISSVPEILNATIFDCYGGCATATTAVNMLTARIQCFDIYNIENTCASASNSDHYTAYLNAAAVKAAIHAPSKQYQECNVTVNTQLLQEFVEPPAYNILPAILGEGIKVHLYSGDYDFLLNHLGSELAIQNMTWFGLQGFQQKPANNFLVDGQTVGNWGYEVSACVSNCMVILV
ncbi:MAG: hypothetical protein OHK93_006479 [Ramalina farinacea]|uniref:Pheromone-processing carboxypeptidase KEX1 n=1 Tax=Ramalina farinacea TaxID=258253 RepID=A0AA43QIP1_9LECA|nr:hypothetical protein [Ramalina farinacea]